MNQCIGHFGAGVVFEHGFHFCADPDVLFRIAEQIADHPDIARMRQFHQHHDIGAMIFQRRMHRMPGALPAIDNAGLRYFFPADIE